MLVRRPSAAPQQQRDPVYRALVAAGQGLFGGLKLRLRVSGAANIPPEGGAVLAITHFGYLDFALAELAVWRTTRRYTRFLVTSPAFEHPVAGPILRSVRMLPVDIRDNRHAFTPAVRAALGGELVGVFPEGEVSPSFTVMPCRTGAVRIAMAADVPLIPVAVWGGHRVITWGRAPSWAGARGVAVDIAFGEPVRYPADALAVEASRELRAHLQTMITSAQDRYPQHPAGPEDTWWLPADRGGTAPLPADVHK